MSTQPGKLGNPDMTLQTDPRLDRRIAQMLEVMDGFAPAMDPLPSDASLEDAYQYVQGFEDGAALGHDMMWAAMPDFPGVEQTTVTIAGLDDNQIDLYVHRPTNVDGPVPCVVHTHGGGMVLMTAADPNFVRLRNDLAKAGNVVVGVEFRNGGGKLGNHPYPAGLNDCVAGARWAYANRAELGISGLIVSGESGGGNLCIATALRAKREGWLDELSGIFAMCPYIYGGYAEPTDDLVSLRENDGYMLDCETMAPMARVYDPDGANQTNPLAWPYHVDVEELRGQVPHVISVNELDPLRDEGLAYYRKLLAAGVSTTGRTSLGTPHAGDGAFPDVTPDLYADLVSAISSFAARVC